MKATIFGGDNIISREPKTMKLQLPDPFDQIPEGQELCSFAFEVDQKPVIVTLTGDNPYTKKEGEGMKISLQKAIEKMTENPGNGDICKKTNGLDCGFMVNDSCQIVTSRDGVKSYPFESADFYGDKWEIIRAEPVVLSADVMYDKMGMAATMATKANSCHYGKAMHQNGRLERDLELRGLGSAYDSLLRKAISYMEMPSCNDFLPHVQHVEKELKNIKPLNKD